MKKKILFIVIAVLMLIPPVVALAADVTIDSAQQYAYAAFIRCGIYWVSPTEGYAFYREYAGDYTVFQKTINGGLTWGSETHVAFVPSSGSFWADWNTPGNSGTKIHTVWTRPGGNYIGYAYVDIYDDSVSGEVIIESTAAQIQPVDLTQCSVSIIKTKGNVLASSYRIATTGVTVYGFETSDDGGNTWITKTSPWEATADHFMLYPANLSDPDDLWGIFWDVSENELSLKTFDYSTNSWSEQLISENMTADTDKYIQMSGDIRHSDGHIILSAWDKFSATNTTLKVWDIGDSSDINEMTNIIDGGNGYFQNTTFIDQQTNDIYVYYLKGTIETSVSVYYQKSTDGGTTWGGEVSFADSTGNYYNLWSGGMKETLGGRAMPLIYQYNVTSGTLKTNYANSIEISSNEFSDPAIAPEYVIDCPTCSDNLTTSGNFTSNETFTGGPPGFAVIDKAAEDSGAPPIWLWGWVGMFSIMVPGFFITYMERKYGAGNGNLILRIMVALIVMGLLVTWQRFDWWMIILYLMVAIAPALMSRQYDWGGAGGVSQHGWIGFCATSWIGLTIINRILEGRFLTASESSWWCSIQLFNEFKVFDLFTLPVINFQFFTVGIPSLLRWDYSFFGGNAEIVQYLLYTITAVVAFILFCIMIGLLFNAFRAR